MQRLAPARAAERNDLFCARRVDPAQVAIALRQIHLEAAVHNKIDVVGQARPLCLAQSETLLAQPPGNHAQMARVVAVPAMGFAHALLQALQRTGIAGGAFRLFQAKDGAIAPLQQMRQHPKPDGSGSACHKDALAGEERMSRHGGRHSGVSHVNVLLGQTLGDIEMGVGQAPDAPGIHVSGKIGGHVAKGGNLVKIPEVHMIAEFSSQYKSQLRNGDGVPAQPEKVVFPENMPHCEQAAPYLGQPFLFTCLRQAALCILFLAEGIGQLLDVNFPGESFGYGFGKQQYFRSHGSAQLLLKIFFKLCTQADLYAVLNGRVG